jgi:ABC-type dipeptide/oligopeptide/nickel transport system permease component
MSLFRFLLRRLSQGLITVVGVVTITFLVSHIIPADPASLMAGERATPQQIAQIRHDYGFDQPLPSQLLGYFRHLLNGDLGRSAYTSRGIAQDLADRLPATLELTLVALVLSVAIGIPVGVLSAVRRNSPLDHAVRLFTVSGYAIASFWLAILLQLLFAMRLEWLPLGGRIDGTPPVTITGLYLIDALVTGNAPAFASAARHIVLPMVTLAFPAMATIVRFTRAGMLEVLGRPYVDYQRAMGLPPGLIVWKYVLRNALTATTTQIGLLAGVLLGGSVVVETIFDWPGLGTYAVNAILLSDYNAVLGVTIWVSVAYIVMNLAVDLVQRGIDPRRGAA